MAKVTVSFVTQEDDSRLIIETDPERNTDYTGKTKTKFRYGDTAYFRVYSHEPESITVCATDGDISELGIYTDSIAGEPVPFITDQTAQTDKPLKALSGYQWLGTSLGGLSASSPYALTAELPPSPADSKVAVASVSYTTAYRLYGLTLSKRELSEYPVMVYVGVSSV